MAAPSPGVLSRTVESFTSSLARQDARNRLSLDFDLLQIEALRDLQANPVAPQVEAFYSEFGDYWAVRINGQLLRTPQRGVQRTFRSEAEALKAGRKAATLEAPEPIATTLERIAADVARVNAASLTEILGINVRASSGLGASIDMFRDRNLSLIRSLVQNQIQDVRTLMESAEVTGLRVEEISEKIQEKFDTSQTKADLLARDQTLKLNADITQARQRGAGVEKYIWTTSGDERVREEHAALEGQVFSWNDPPPPGHPGEDYQCRCTAFPVIEEFDDTTGLDLGLVSSAGAVNSALDD